MEGTLHGDISPHRKINICQKILKISENHPVALSTLVGHYWNCENLDEAYIYLKRLADSPNPSPNDIFSLGEYYFIKNRYEESIAAYKNFLKLSVKAGTPKIVERKKHARKQITLLKKLIEDKTKWPPEPEASVTAMDETKEQYKNSSAGFI